LQRAVTLDEKRFRPVPKHYIVDGILGAGAFGVVLKCRNTIIRVKGVELVCAVKTFRETDLERPLADVFAEANTIKGLTHANVIGVLDFGFADSDAQARPFLAMEFFPGVTLEDHLAAHGKLSVADFRAVFGQIAAGLHAAHTADEPVIHRDLKPANVMLMKVGEKWVVKVIDYGLAVRSVIRVAGVNVPPAHRSTRDKAVAGTVKYAAPEQMQEKPYPVGPHSDVYAFGKTALESLLGTVNPTQKHWKQLGELADLLARCVDEEFDAKNSDEGRFHGFGPVLAVLSGERRDGSSPVQAPAPVEEVLELIPEPAAKPPVAKRVEPTTPAITADPVTEFAAWRAQVAEVAAQAERAADVFDYGRAVTLYAGVPAKRRDEGQLTQWTAKRDRLAAVWGEVEGGWKEMSDEELATRLEEVVSLHPDHPKAKAWLAQFGTAADRRKAKLARLKAGDRHEITLPGGVPMALAYIPPGKFLMGSPASEKDRQDNETQHPVTLTNGFYMGVHPVTQAQYQAVMGTNPSNWKGNALPVEQVSWEDAVAFCGAVKQKTGAELRLPTEAEWEYAARGGTTTPFYWGSELNGTQANCNGNYPYGTTTKVPSLEKTTVVGTYAAKYPHPWGLTDVIGNVWEWCSDWYDAGFYAKPEATTPDPECKDSIQTYRVLRGGSWYNGAWYCRAAYRNYVAPADRHYDVGFRVCVALD